MQRLTQIFRRKQPVKATSDVATKSPVPLKPEELKNVAGGLPNVGGFTATTSTPSKLG